MYMLDFGRLTFVHSQRFKAMADFFERDRDVFEHGRISDEARYRPRA